LLIDLIDERFDVVVNGSGATATRSNEFLLATLPTAEPITATLRAESQERFDAWTQAVRLFRDAVDQYGVTPKVVLHKAWWANQRQDGRAMVKFPQQRIERANAALVQMYAVFESAFPECRVVEAGGQHLLAATEHKWGESPFHYVDEYYEDVMTQLLA
jgi:hypothetical protein